MVHNVFSVSLIGMWVNATLFWLPPSLVFLAVAFASCSLPPWCILSSCYFFFFALFLIAARTFCYLLSLRYWVLLEKFDEGPYETCAWFIAFCLLALIPSSGSENTPWDSLRRVIRLRSGICAFVFFIYIWSSCALRGGSLKTVHPAPRCVTEQPGRG